MLEDDSINQISNSLEKLELKEGDVWPRCVTVDSESVVAQFEGVGIKVSGAFPLPQKLVALMQHPPFEGEMHKRSLSTMAIQPLFLPFPLFTPTLVTLTTGIVDTSELEELALKMSELDSNYLALTDKTGDEAKHLISAYYELSQMYHSKRARLSTFIPICHAKVMTSCDIFHYYMKVLTLMRVTNFSKLKATVGTQKEITHLFSQIDDEYESDVQRIFEEVSKQIPHLDQVLTIVSRYGQMMEDTSILNDIDLMEICRDYTYKVIQTLEKLIMSVCGVSEQLYDKIYLTNQPRIDLADVHLYEELRVRLFMQDGGLGISRQRSLGSEWIFFGDHDDNIILLHGEISQPIGMSNNSKCLVLTALGRKLLHVPLNEAISFVKRNILSSSGDQTKLFSTHLDNPFTLIQNCSSPALLIF